MKKTFKTVAFLFTGIALISYSFAAGDEEVYKYDYPVVPEMVNEDTYYDDGVLLRNISLPGDLGEDAGTISASFEGSGTLVIGDRKNGGYPRIVLPAGDVSVSYYFAPEEKKVYWDGRITPPKRTLKPKKAEVQFAVTGNHFGDIELESAYQIGLDQEKFSFPSGTALVYFLDVPDETRIWYARQPRSDDEIEEARDTASDPLSGDHIWIANEEDFCVVKNKLCVITNLSSEENKIIFFQESFSSCPRLRIDNGYYSGIPHCNVRCDSGYTLDFDSYTCVEKGSANIEASYEVDLSKRADYGIDYKLRPGYFKYRDSRGSQLEKKESEGLNGKDLDIVEYSNAVKSPRTDNNEGTGSNGEKLDSLWKELQNLDLKFWQSQNEVRPDPVLLMDDPAQSYEEKVANCEGCQEDKPTTFGAMLPSTGPAGFIGVSLFGLILLSLGLKRR